MSASQPSDAVAAVERLRRALEQLAAALAEPKLEGLLESESAIEAALHDLPSRLPAGRDDAAALRASIEGARRAVLRSRRLGASLGDVVRRSLDAQGHQQGYGPRVTEPTYAGGVLNARG